MPFLHRLPVTEGDHRDPTNHLLALRDLVLALFQKKEPSRRDFLALFRPLYPGAPLISKPHLPPHPILDVFWNSARSMFADYVLAVPV